MQQFSMGILISEAQFTQLLLNKDSNPQLAQLPWVPGEIKNIKSLA